MSAAKTNLPDKYRPLSMWEYFGYNILYGIPLVGWVFMIIFALDDSNINRRNFTRSFFVGFIIFAVFLVIMIATGAMLGFVEYISENMN